jgi:hypothetical protein
VGRSPVRTSLLASWCHTTGGPRKADQERTRS